MGSGEGVHFDYKLDDTGEEAKTSTPKYNVISKGSNTRGENKKNTVLFLRRGWRGGDEGEDDGDDSVFAAVGHLLENLGRCVPRRPRIGEGPLRHRCWCWG